MRGVVNQEGVERDDNKAQDEREVSKVTENVDGGRETIGWTCTTDIPTEASGLDQGTGTRRPALSSATSVRLASGCVGSGRRKGDMPSSSISFARCCCRWWLRRGGRAAGGAAGNDTKRASQSSLPCPSSPGK